MPMLTPLQFPWKYRVSGDGKSEKVNAVWRQVDKEILEESPRPAKDATPEQLEKRKLLIPRLRKPRAPDELPEL
jgi:hypothetical protein